MKSIKLLLSIILLLSFFSLSAQDDFYNDSKKKKNSKNKVEQVDDNVIFNISEYSTERDYNEEHNITASYEVFDGDEFYDDQENKKKRKRRRNSVVGEVVAEIVVEETGCTNASIEYTGGDRGWAGDIPRAMLGIDKMMSTGYDVRFNSEDAIRHTAKALILEIGIDEEMNE